MLDLGMFTSSRVPLVRQTEISECGLACLTMVARYHGLDIDLGTLRRRTPLSTRGATLRSLMQSADILGFTSRAVKVPLDGIPSLALPCILHWDLNHFVVLEKVSSRRALIHNPDGRSAWLSMSEISRHFTGVALELRRSPSFRAEYKRERLSLSQLITDVRGIKRFTFQIIILSIVMQLFVLLSPYYMQLAVDSVVPSSDRALLMTLAFGFGIFTVINFIASLLRSFVLMVAGTTIAYNLTSAFAYKLFRLPIDWFSRRQSGDIISRFQSIHPIQDMLTQGAIAALLDGALATVTLALMFWYSVPLGAITLFSFLIYIIIRLVSFRIEREAQADSIVAKGKEQTALIETMRGITALRLYNKEQVRHSYWLNRLTNSTNSEVRVSRVHIWQANLNLLVSGLDNIAVVAVAILLVIRESGFSLGMVFAFMAYKSQFTERSSNFLDQAIAFKMLGLHLERLSDIALSDPDPCFTSTQYHSAFMIGSLELRNISYRYSPVEPYVLKDLNLVVKPGEHLAITGLSGGGKSTLINVILGLIKPENGVVLVDGRSINEFGYASFREQVAAVLQDDSLFAGSLAFNIGLFEENVSMDNVIAAATAASIHDDIMAMPMKYETLVGEMGSSLSGGQRQRVLLARALYRKPRMLIMDEGTAHIDAYHEKAVNAAIAAMGITRIIVAHRIETINNAERVMIMADGRLHEKERPKSI